MANELEFFIDDLAHLRRLNLDYYSQRLYDIFPEFEAMARCPQDPIWHAEGDVLIHTQMVIDAALSEIEAATDLSPNLPPDLPRSLRQSIYLAALLHDVGKPSTTYTSEGGRVVSPGHSKAGLPLARSILYRLGVPFEAREH